MQRLFSTFASGWPGRGLLIQRVLVGGAVFYCGFQCLKATPICRTEIQHNIGVVAGLLLIAGLWTPVAGALLAGMEVWMALSAPAAPGIPVAVAVLASTLAMIGPGTWSVDALLYGRKHIDFPGS